MDWDYSGDTITHVDDAAVAEVGPDKAITSIKGPRGSTVSLTILRGEETIEFAVIRDEIIFHNVTSEIIDNDDGHFGYVHLRSFMSLATCKDVQEAILGFKEQQQELKGIILDLRDNGGGRLDKAACLMGMFVGPGKVVIQSQDIRTNRVLSTTMSTGRKITDLPMVVLINARSASASEIVAGALKDYERAIVVGETTFGKGTVQGLGAWFYNNKVLNARTIARFHLPSGWSNQKTGVTPEVEVYRTPNPSEMDKFAIRESDEFLPVPSGTTSYTPSAKRRALTGKINTCLAKLDTAERAFERLSNDLYKPDFQMLQAMDTLTCR